MGLIDFRECVEETPHLFIALRGLAREQTFGERAAQNRDDAHVGPPENMLQEDALKLDRVLHGVTVVFGVRPAEPPSTTIYNLLGRR